MRLIDTTCPKCNAHMKVDAENKQVKCEFCGATFMIDDQIQHVRYDNAEEAGYQFERGRQKAQAEAAYHAQMAQQYYAPTPPPPAKKGKLWLWVIGWLFCFPIPLSVILWRKLPFKKSVKIGILVAMWLILFAISAATPKEETPKEAETVAVNSETTAKTALEEEAPTIITDSVVQEFVSKYNTLSDSPLDGVEQGNIRTKYYAFSHGYYLELLHSDATDKMAITITETNENAELGVQGMKEVFHDIAKTIDESLTDEAINEYFDTMVSSEHMKEDTLGNMKVLYAPDVELSGGYTRGHIEIDEQ